MEIEKSPGLDDDELSHITGIRPRQQVNQICRMLEGRGMIRRVRGNSGKIVNIPAGAGDISDGIIRPVSIEGNQSSHWRIPGHETRVSEEARPWVIQPLLIHEDLIILPCSGRKAQAGNVVRPRTSILEDLPPELRRRLEKARDDVRERAHVDESTLVSAWQRYSGALYESARSELQALVERGAHLLILSGGYGVLHAREPIGSYEAVFKPSWWPTGLMQEVLFAYFVRHKLRRMRAFVSRTTAYRKIIERTAWREAGADDAVIISPEAGDGALLKAPRAQGEAFAAMTHGRVSSSWRSSDGLSLDCQRIV